MHPNAIGFTKEAGLRELAGKALKRVGRSVGSSNLEHKGLTMQTGAKKLITSPTGRKSTPIPDKFFIATCIIEAAISSPNSSMSEFNL